MSEVTWTIKAGKGYDESWAVFKGSPEDVKKDMIQAFGLPAEALDLTTYVVAQLAEEVLQGLSTVETVLGGRVTGEAVTTPESIGYDKGAPKAAKKAEEKPYQAIYDAIEAETDVTALRALWARNKDAFNDDPGLMEASKAKSKSLSA